ncbi:MAG: serine/threonine protein kinase [Prevotella ruminicola]|jgi:serine/threonine-protein kinase|uniref:mitogen-activated protein kinase kinase n=1 Tax=Xylanibacter ruminicola TaxID=839 RepID=A0A928GHV3_XYLRU|nr:serine/threonine protein kinase [Xylanibacter ruminicola]
MAAFQTVQQRPGDPNIYLYVMGEWYCYNPLEPPLGSGAMGDVYRGYRCSNGAVIAIKRVKDAYANNKMIRERARQEASLAFRHPNLVEMIGCCEYAPDSGPIFLLSHFVEGVDIDKFVKGFAGSPTRVEKICNAICSVLDALDYVHSRGVVHRDIKPSNIMIENGSNVRLMDLGIARMNGGNKFSSYGFIGTPEYSAPEQILREQNGASVQIDATTDIYALGITLYELLAGENPMACEAEAETLAKQMKSELPASPEIPKKLMRVIWKATEKEQSKRFQTALEFKEAIKESFFPDPTLTERILQWFKDRFNL